MCLKSILSCLRWDLKTWTHTAGSWKLELGSPMTPELSGTLPAPCIPQPSQARCASDGFPVALELGWEWGGGSATAGLRALRGIPIELFLMCFNFHFLLLENTDSDLLPLTHTEQCVDRREMYGKCMHRTPPHTHSCGTGASNQGLWLLWASVSPSVKWEWLRWTPEPLPAPQSMRRLTVAVKRVQFKGHRWQARRGTGEGGRGTLWPWGMASLML